MKTLSEVLYAIEVHSAEDLISYFRDGGNPNELHDEVPLFKTMVEMYLRSPRFKDCVKAFIDYGLNFPDQPLLAVLSDDAEALKVLIQSNPDLVHRQYFMFNNTFTPLSGVTLLHYCAEYGHLACARLLIQEGAEVDAPAALDDNGFGGHTPLFHAVAQHDNNSGEVLQLLLDHSADALLTVRGLVWGKGYEWETFIPAVNPTSYCMMGLLPQMHRKPEMIAENIALLLKHSYGLAYELPNIPNAYLNS